MHDVGKTLHVLLLGCNTVNLVLPLHQKLSAIRPEALGSVWMLATSDVWPGDLSTFLWCNYGSLVTHDLADFRRATRVGRTLRRIHSSLEAAEVAGCIDDSEGRVARQLGASR